MLSLLPPEVWQVISEHLSAINVGHLYFSGNKHLNDCLLRRGGVTNFALCYTPAMALSFPSLVYAIQKLQVLSLSHSDIIGWTPQLRGLELAKLPPSLRVLRLQFIGLGMIFFQPPVDAVHLKPIDIRSALPNLQKIETHPTEMLRAFSNPKFMRFWPSSLTTLRLSWAFRISDLANIPASVINLVLDISPRDPWNWIQDPQLPDGLKTLEILQNASFDVIRWLPPSLTQLFLNVPRHSTYVSMPPHWSTLPKGLRSLEMTYLPLTPAMVPLLPPAMTFLRIGKSSPCSLLPSDFLGLPRSLTHLELPLALDDFPAIAFLTNLPMSLTRLPEVLEQAIQDTTEVYALSTYFEKLQKLALTSQLETAVLAHLPTSLTELHLLNLRETQSALLPLLPPNLCALYVNLLPECMIGAVGSAKNRLETLVIHRAFPHSPLPNLPPSLKTLQVEGMSLYQSISEWGNNWPPTLTSLSINCEKVVLSKTDFLLGLPKTLVQLSVINGDRYNLSSEMLLDAILTKEIFAHLSNLQELHLGFFAAPLAPRHLACLSNCHQLFVLEVHTTGEARQAMLTAETRSALSLPPGLVCLELSQPFIGTIPILPAIKHKSPLDGRVVVFD